MSDDSFPPDWQVEPPDPRDPLLGSDLDPLRPNAAQRAAVLELMLAYIAREPAFGREFLDFGAKAYRDKTWDAVRSRLADIRVSEATPGLLDEILRGIRPRSRRDPRASHQSGAERGLDGCSNGRGYRRESSAGTGHPAQAED